MTFAAPKTLQEAKMLGITDPIQLAIIERMQNGVAPQEATGTGAIPDALAPYMATHAGTGAGMPLIEQLMSSGQLDQQPAAPQAPAPMEAAMGAPAAPQGLQVDAEGKAPSLSGIEQAMMGEDFESQAIAEMPNAPPQKKLGLLGRIRQQPGGSRALLALGASLLSDQNFFSGLGKGAMAYQGVLDEEAEKRKPKVDYLAQGAFQVTYDPVTGKRVIERTPVADFEEKNLATKLQTQRLIAGERTQAQRDMNTEDNIAAIEREKLSIKAQMKIAEENRDFDRWKVLKETETQLEAARLKGGEGGGKSPPVSAIKARQQAKLDRVNIDQSVKGINMVLADIDSGKFDPDLLSNTLSSIRTGTGIGVNEYDQAKQRLESTVQRAVRAILSSNVGVQTQIDAERAQMEILSSKSSAAIIKDALRRLRTYLNEAGTAYDGTLEDLDNTFDFGGSSGGGSSSKPRSIQDLRNKYGLE